MGQQMKTPDLIELDSASSIWEKFFTLFPLVVIGTRKADGSDDLAPKHLAEHQVHRIPARWSEANRHSSEHPTWSPEVPPTPMPASHWYIN